MSKPDLLTMSRDLKFRGTVKAPDGNVDFFTLHAPAGRPGVAVSIGVPHGRRDLADFIFRCIKARQHTLIALPPGTPFIADEAMPNLGRKPS